MACTVCSINYAVFGVYLLYVGVCIFMRYIDLSLKKSLPIWKIYKHTHLGIAIIWIFSVCGYVYTGHPLFLATGGSLVLSGSTMCHYLTFAHYRQGNKKDCLFVFAEIGSLCYMITASVLSHYRLTVYSLVDVNEQ